MTKLESLPNLGPVASSNLRAIGVNTAEEFRKMGSKQAFLKIRAEVDSGACLAFLMCLVGAERGVPKKLLPQEVKDEYKAFYKSL